MTLETLEKAKKIFNEMESLESALDQAKNMKECIFGIERMSLLSGKMEFIYLPERCKDGIIKLLENELVLLKKELKDL